MTFLFMESSKLAAEKKAIQDFRKIYRLERAEIVLVSTE
jgi:hypothetical protein